MGYHDECKYICDEQTQELCQKDAGPAPRSGVGILLRGKTMGGRL
jgi:hypothetical protein